MAGMTFSNRSSVLSVAAIHGAPARAPRRGNHPADIAAAAIVGRAAEIEARTATPVAMMPAMVSAVMPPNMMTVTMTVAAACRSCGRHRSGCADQCSGSDESECEFAEHDPLLIRGAKRRSVRLCLQRDASTSCSDSEQANRDDVNGSGTGSSDTVHVCDIAVRSAAGVRVRNQDLSRTLAF